MSTPTDPPQTNGTEKKGVGGPVWVGWREGTLTRAKELESLWKWVCQKNPQASSEALSEAVPVHLDAARDAAKASLQTPRKRFRNGPLIERAASNLDAAEALILDVASADYVLGQMPSLLRHVQCHLIPSDPRRLELERIAQMVGVKDPDHPLIPSTKEDGKDAAARREEKLSIIEDEHGKIVTAVRGASSAALREQLRLRSFRLVVIITTVVMLVLAVVVALIGYFYRTWIPLCFAPPEASDRTVVVVCPTAQSGPHPSDPEAIDRAIKSTVQPQDLLVIELVGLTAAAIAATTSIRRIRGSSERIGLPVALALLKLPTGAITAFLGLLLMRGQFVPGLTALDTSAQILAWALVFGFAQQLFTRLADQQGQVVLESVRGASKPISTPSPP